MRWLRQAGQVSIRRAGRGVRRGLLALALAAAAQTGWTADWIEVTLTGGHGMALERYEHRGRTYSAGEPGAPYGIRLRNRSPERVLAVVSVDGINVISGHTAAYGQSGYVLPPFGELEVTGWRKSLDGVAGFYFTEVPDSYASRTGRPEHVGVIGVAVFRERARIAHPRDDLRVPDSVARGAAPPASEGAQHDRRRSARPEQRQDAQSEFRQGELGTGHGEWRDAPASITRFERASRHPEQVVRLYYDSLESLIARGIVSSRYAGPDPFPQRFVPDPTDD